MRNYTACHIKVPKKGWRHKCCSKKTVPQSERFFDNHYKSVSIKINRIDERQEKSIDSVITCFLNAMTTAIHYDPSFCIFPHIFIKHAGAATIYLRGCALSYVSIKWSMLTCVYFWVVERLLWPNSSCTARKSAPASSM